MKQDFDDYELHEEYDLEQLRIMPKGRYAHRQPKNSLATPSAAGLKHDLVCQIAQLMQEKNFSKATMAQQLNTNLTMLDKLLDPKNDAITLRMLEQIALILGKQLRVELV